MTDALAALGLPPGADEREVRRAYARLLRSVRPDADPAGFQALHEAYRAALDGARRVGPTAGEAAEGEAAEGTTSGLPDPSEAEPRGAEPRPPAGDGAAAAHGRFTIDLGSLVPALLARAAAGTAAELAAWLDGATSDWPLAARPAVAPHLLEALDDGEAALAPAQFDAVAEAFGFADVFSGVDPLRVAAVRAGVEARHAARLRAAALADVLRPDNRPELCRRMGWTGRGGYAPPVTRLLAAVVTGPGSPARARVLRFVPFLTGSVWRFLQNIDEGRTDAFGPAIPAGTVAAWARADERRWRIEPGAVYVALVALCILASAVFEMLGSGPPAREAAPRSGTVARVGMLDLRMELDEAGRALGIGDVAKAIGIYDRIVAFYGPAPPDGLMGPLGNVYYGRAVLLDTFGPVAKARDAYELFELAFAEADDPDTRALVVRARERRAALDRR